MTPVPLSTGDLLFYGLSTSVGNVTFSSLLQSRVPEGPRGRAFAGFDVLWQTGRLFSLLGGRLLADEFAISAAYLLGGLLLLVATVVGAQAACDPRRPLQGRLTDIF